MEVIKYNKLIRDNIPEIIINSGKTPIIKNVEGEDLINLLNQKIHEELAEYNESGSIEELADLVEVVYAILDNKGVSLEEFEGIRQNKNHKRGAFKKGLVLIEVREN